MSQKSEIRKDYFLNKYVIITPGRAKRPRDVKAQSHIERIGDCVFCDKNIEKDLIVKILDKDDKKITIIKNKFPALESNNEKAYGHQEVIIDTPIHGKELAETSQDQIERVLRAYADRTTEHTKDKKIEYILAFKNKGGKAGASILHAHSQIFASQILPPDIMDELQQSHKYQIKQGSCPYCDILKDEEKSSRQIYHDENIVAFCPYASEYHYEAWILTRRHLDNITKLNDDEFKSFSAALHKILKKLFSLGLDYNFFMHQIIKDDDQHFFLKIQPRDSIWAGVEIGSGLVINSMPPEIAAKVYRDEE